MDRLDEDVAYAPVVSKVSASGRGYRFYVNQGRLGIVLDNGIDREFFETEPLVANGQFTHVAFALFKITEATTRQVVLMVNGEIVFAEDANIAWSFDSPGESFHLGFDPLPVDGEVRHFRGVIDEPALYSGPALLSVNNRQSLVFNAGSCGRCRFQVSTPTMIGHDSETDSALGPGLLRNLSPYPLQLQTETREVLPGNQPCESSSPGNLIEFQETAKGPVVTMAPFESTELAFETSFNELKNLPIVGEYRYRVEDLLSGQTNDTSIVQSQYPVSGTSSVYVLDVHPTNVVGYSEGAFIELRPGRNHRIDLEISNPSLLPVEVGPLFGYFSRDDSNPATSMRIDGRFQETTELRPAFIVPPKHIHTVTFVVSCDRYLGVGNDVASLHLFDLTASCDGLGFLESVHFRILPEVSVDCEADINADGRVDGADLAMILGDWSTDTGLTDLDRNGEVGASDLGLLLSSWGICGN